jgi:ribosome maturation factor RimP
MESGTTESKIEALLLPLLEGSDMFIISVKIKPTNNIKVYLDADSGLNVSKSASVNRKLYYLIEESGMFPDGDYSLEVSSPGIDEPLVSMRQYQKNVGRTVEVTPLEGTEIRGILKEVSEERLVITTKGEKKKAPADIEVPLNFIKKTVVQVTF